MAILLMYCCNYLFIFVVYLLCACVAFAKTCTGSTLFNVCVYFLSLHYNVCYCGSIHIGTCFVVIISVD